MMMLKNAPFGSDMTDSSVRQHLSSPACSRHCAKIRRDVFEAHISALMILEQHLLLASDWRGDWGPEDSKDANELALCDGLRNICQWQTVPVTNFSAAAFICVNESEVDQ